MENKKPIYTLHPLFDFQAICDTDIGLYRLIKKEYYDKSVFKNELFDSKDEMFIRTELLCRKNFNPLFLFCKENIMSDEELDDLYQQFLDEEYDKIIDLSPITSIMNLAATSNSVRDIVTASILCKTDKEKEWVYKYTKKLNCIVSEYKQFKLDRFDSIYIKDIYTLLLFDQSTLKDKNILISRFNFNLENEYTKVELPIMNISQKYYKNNKFMLIDPYKNISIPMGEMN